MNVLTEVAAETKHALSLNLACAELISQTPVSDQIQNLFLAYTGSFNNVDTIDKIFEEIGARFDFETGDKSVYGLGGTEPSLETVVFCGDSFKYRAGYTPGKIYELMSVGNALNLEQIIQFVFESERDFRLSSNDLDINHCFLEIFEPGMVDGRKVWSAFYGS